jgi:hypothetical protein
MKQVSGKDDCCQGGREVFWDFGIGKLGNLLYSKMLTCFKLFISRGTISG